MWSILICIFIYKLGNSTFNAKLISCKSTDFLSIIIHLKDTKQICRLLNFLFPFIDIIQHWKMQEIWNPFHGQNYSISNLFSTFECTSSKSWHAWNGRETDLILRAHFNVVCVLYRNSLWNPDFDIDIENCLPCDYVVPYVLVH